ncbi:MAG: FAD:protein FMN transferase [Lentisphaeria bacterium]|nr:FAD:protein FMN transferase [Lentisphaeria bacterium]
MKRTAVLALITIVLGISMWNRSQNGKFFRQENQLLGTVVSVTFYGNQSNAKAASNEIFDDLNVINETINIFDPASEISKLNLSADKQPFVCSDLLWDFIQAGRKAYKVTEGRFDVSVAPLMTLWGLHKKQDVWPSKALVTEALTKVGLNKIKFDDEKHSVFFSKQGMKLDFGGLVKGIALDRCRKVMEKHGVEVGLVNLGGNIYCTEKAPDGRESFFVGIKNPSAGLSDTIKVNGCFVATSGDYERFTSIEGKRIAHIINPLTGYPVDKIASVSVITQNGFNSDLFSTTLFIDRKSMVNQLKVIEPTLEYMVIMHKDDGYIYESLGKKWHKDMK